MSLKTKGLLTQLARIESTLNDFSFEELKSDEAKNLQKSFLSFKNNLEHKLFREAITADGITESYENEHEEIAVNYQQDSLEEAKKLIAHVSHEIRTPLNGIIGFTDLLKEDKLSSLQMERVSAIQTASYSLLDIINELLEYSKISAGLEKFEIINFNFSGLIKDVIYLCNTLIVDKNINLHTKIDSRISKTLVGDPSKLTQILLNLIGNAIKFVETGEIFLGVELSERKGKNQLLKFTLKDTGVGISEEALKNIFDSFKQENHTTYLKYGGSGLGLSLVKQIIEKLNGDIQITSKLGVGTTFYFTIPYTEGDDSKIKESKADNSSSRKGSQLIKDTNILVFEDNELNQRLIKQHLINWECNIFITADAKTGINILEKENIEVVLMDLRMPGKDGFEVSKLIRNSNMENVKKVPIIAVSADFSVEDKKQCATYGINDFVLKPYNPEELLLKIVKNKNTIKSAIDVPTSMGVVHEDIDNQQSVDLEGVLEECVGEIEVLEELIVLFKGNAIEFIGLVRTHLNNEDIEQVGFAAHKIKAGLAMLKTKKLHSIIVEMQNVCKTNVEKKYVEELYERFLVEYPKTEIEIDKALKKIKSNNK